MQCFLLHLLFHLPQNTLLTQKQIRRQRENTQATMAHPAHTERSNTAAVIQSSPLLDLAAELRNYIWRLALTTDGQVKIDKTTFLQHKALLDTCRQIRNEALQIFYAENEFLITAESFVVAGSSKWLSTIGDFRSVITRIQIDIPLSTASIARFGWEALKNQGSFPDLSHRDVHDVLHEIASMQCPEVFRAIQSALRAGVKDGVLKTNYIWPKKAEAQYINSHLRLLLEQEGESSDALEGQTDEARGEVDEAELEEIEGAANDASETTDTEDAE